MFGKTEVFRGAVIVISVIAAGSDLIQGKIYNWLTVPALIGGTVFLFWTDGWLGVMNSAFGIALGLALYGWMFWMGFMGGGDVKLLMALGAWGGTFYVLETGVVAVLVGGVLAALSLLSKGKMGSFLSRMKASLLSVFIKQLEYIHPKLDTSMTMPYGVSIAIAAIWTSWGSPFAQLGIRIW